MKEIDLFDMAYKGKLLYFETTYFFVERSVISKIMKHKHQSNVHTVH